MCINKAARPVSAEVFRPLEKCLRRGEWIMIIYWATKLRGFLKHISSCTEGVQFVQKDQYYETSSKLRILKSKLIRFRIFDPIGLFQIINVSKKNCDYYGSYNRFLKADKPYFIYLENPTALYHYALGRIQYPAGKKRFELCLKDANLKYIVCMSEACRLTFEKVTMPLPESVKIKTIYPLVPRNKHVDEDAIRKKSYADVLECLYCVQGKRFYTKGGKCVLKAVTRLQKMGFKIHLTVITDPSVLDRETMDLINESDSISLFDFSFSFEELEEIYAKTAVLLQPSSDDSSALTVLEAMKGGCAVLGSKLYAIPEMVKQNENGILIDPMYRTFTTDNMPNPAAWGYKKKIRLSKKESQKYIGDIENSLRSLYENRDMLCKFSKRSLEIANTKFGEETIVSQWEDVWNALKGGECL